MATSVDDEDACDVSLEENKRIYRALSALRAASAPSSAAGEGNSTNAGNTPARRTWGTLCTRFADQNDARMHAFLRPFLHFTAASPAALSATLRAALGRAGMQPTEHDDLFEVVGAVQGDGARQVQLFFNPNKTQVEEYLLLA